MTAWKGRIVAVGSIDDPADNTVYRPHAAVWTSTDGISWSRTFRYKTGGSVINEVVPLDGRRASRLVGIGTALKPQKGEGCGFIPNPEPIGIWTSPDGLAWKREAQSSVFNGATINAAASNRGTILAIGDTGYLDPQIWITTDGLTWQRETLPQALFRDAHLTDIAAVPGGWILGSYTLHHQDLGCVGPDNPDHAAAWYSADGRHWQKAAIRWPDGTVRHGDVRGFQVTSAAIGAGDFQSVDGGKSWTWDLRTRLPYGPNASDGRRLILQTEDPTGANTGGNPDEALPLFSSTDLRSWQQLGASGDVPSGGYLLDELFMLPGGIAALGSADADGLPLLWVAAAT